VDAEGLCLRFYMGKRLNGAMEKKDGQGQLMIRVTTAGGIVPLLDASVAVSKNEMLLHHTLTDNGGAVPCLTVMLPKTGDTYSALDGAALEVRVFLWGYAPITRRVWVYPDKVTYLQVNMVPRCEALGVSEVG